MVELGYSKRDIVIPICKDSKEVLVRSAMEGRMGRVWVDDLEKTEFLYSKNW